MACFGGYAPFPMRLGESRAPVKDINRGLNSSRGTALDTTELSSPVWVENHAIARAIADVWATNERVSLQTDLSRTSLLARWEAIFGIVPPPGQSDSQRRAVLFQRQTRIGKKAVRQQLIDELAATLSPITFDIVTSSYAGGSDAIASYFGSWYLSSSSPTAGSMYLRGVVSEGVTVHVLVKTAQYQSGSFVGYAMDVTASSESLGSKTFSITNSGSYDIPGTGLTLSYVGGLVANDYYLGIARRDGFTSTVAEMTLAVSVPSWMTNADYYERVSKVYGLLDDLLPAWVSVHIARDYSVAGSLILSNDATPNLDNQRLSG